MALFQLNSAEADSWPSFVLSLAGERQLAAAQAQQTRPGRPVGPLAVSLHAYHLDLVPHLIDRLEASGLADADLWISTDTPAKADALAHLLNHRGWPPAACHIQCMANRGRNVLPLLRQLEHHLQAYDAVLHLHTKRTERDGLGEAWRDDLLGKLLGSADQVQRALALLTDPSVGLVLPCRFAGIDRYYKWGIEFPAACDLLKALVPERQLLPSQLLVFPAGMMFWLRPAALRPLARLYAPESAWQAFAPEPLPTRGTLAHAIERSLCHLVEAGAGAWRLLDGPTPADAAPAAPLAPLPTPSVWGGTETAYFEELARLTARLQRLERQARRQAAPPVPLQPLQRHPWFPWRQPLTLALVLPRAGRGFTSSAYVRWLLPLQTAERQGHCRLLLLQEAHDPALASCDAVVVQRAAVASRRQVRDWRQRCQLLGVPLVFDLDDALFALGADHPEAASQRPAVAVIDALMAAADHLIVSTAELRRACLRRLARRGQPQPPVTVIANGLDPQLWGLPHRLAASPWPAADGALRLLYMGTPTHDIDLQPVLEAMDQLHRQQPGRVELVLVGGLASGLERDWLTTVPVPLAQRRYPGFVPWLRQLPACHVGLAPLADTAFNRCKSDLKALDYTALGLACLCSDLAPYQGLIRKRLVRPVAADGWREAIEGLRGQQRELTRRLPAAHRHLWRQRRSDQVGRELLRLLRSLAAANHR